LARFNELRAELDNAAETKLTYLKFDEVEDGRKGVLAPGDSEYKSETVVDREKREWEDILRPFVEKGDTWLSAPWLVTEVRFMLFAWYGLVDTSLFISHLLSNDPSLYYMTRYSSTHTDASLKRLDTTTNPTQQPTSTIRLR
jgi:hypothetical protein